MIVKLEKILAFSCLAALPIISHAGCSRADVEFYLSKNFSNEQIASICQNQQSDSEVQPRQVAPALSSEEFNDNVHAIAANLAIDDLHVDDDKIQFSERRRLVSGKNQLNGEDVTFSFKRLVTVMRRELRVIGTEPSMSVFKYGSLSLGDKFSSKVYDLEQFSAHRQQLIADFLKTEGDKIIVLKARFNGDMQRASNALMSLQLPK